MMENTKTHRSIPQQKKRMRGGEKPLGGTEYVWLKPELTEKNLRTKPERFKQAQKAYEIINSRACFKQMINTCYATLELANMIGGRLSGYERERNSCDVSSPRNPSFGIHNFEESSSSEQ